MREGVPKQGLIPPGTGRQQWTDTSQIGRFLPASLTPVRLLDGFLATGRVVAGFEGLPTGADPRVVSEPDPRVTTWGLIPA